MPSSSGFLRPGVCFMSMTSQQGITDLISLSSMIGLYPGNFEAPAQYVSGYDRKLGGFWGEGAINYGEWVIKSESLWVGCHLTNGDLWWLRRKFLWWNLPLFGQFLPWLAVNMGSCENKITLTCTAWIILRNSRCDDTTQLVFLAFGYLVLASWLGLLTNKLLLISQPSELQRKETYNGAILGF